MSFAIEFAHEFRYKDFGNDIFPALDVRLIGPNGGEDLIAIIDTGAKYCIFNGLRAASIGLELMAGRPENLSSLAGQLMVRIHSVVLEIFGTQFQCEVAFSEHHIPRELLGRHTLFTKVRFGFRERDSTGYFHPAP